MGLQSRPSLSATLILIGQSLLSKPSTRVNRWGKVLERHKAFWNRT